MAIKHCVVSVGQLSFPVGAAAICKVIKTLPPYNHVTGKVVT